MTASLSRLGSGDQAGVCGRWLHRELALAHPLNGAVGVVAGAQAVDDPLIGLEFGIKFRLRPRGELEYSCTGLAALS